ncbi:MAG: NAD(P)/FAD-dependent oxidoreductase [Peptococcaceae bacterium]|nr:NAD(P)/FAD-dependent oxidoreductase [Peptococcaceae bacterium]
MRYVVIGNSAAGIFGIEAIRECDPEGDIILITNEPESAYSRCLTTHYIAGKVTENQMYIRPGDFYQRYAVDVRFGVTVESVDPAERKVLCEGGIEVPFDRLLIATGASPVIPETPGINAAGVFTLRTINDARAIRKRVERGGRAVVLGAGPVGLKTAYALLKRGVRVSVVVGSPQILSRAMDAYGAGLIQKQLEEHGMTFYLGREVKEILENDAGEVSGVRLEDGTELLCSMVIVGKGVRPNVQLVTRDMFEINRGLVVNEYLETSCTGVFAAGDVAETYDIAYGYPRVNATWPNATAQGRLAGRNMAGCRERYPGSIGLNSLEFFGLDAITVGMSRAEGPEFEVLEHKEETARRYRRLVFREDKLVGYVAVNDIDGIGALTARVKASIPVRNKRALLVGRPPVVW